MARFWLTAQWMARFLWAAYEQPSLGGLVFVRRIEKRKNLLIDKIFLLTTSFSLSSMPSFALSIRESSDGRVAVIDTISHYLKLSQPAASKKFGRLKSTHKEICAQVKYIRFPNLRPRVPVADHQTMIELLLVLPGKDAQKFRYQFAREFCARFAINPQSVPLLALESTFGTERKENVMEMVDVDNKHNKENTLDDDEKEKSEFRLQHLHPVSVSPRSNLLPHKRKYDEIIPGDIKNKTQELEALKVYDEISQLKTKVWKEKISTRKLEFDLEMSACKMKTESEEFQRTSESRIAECFRGTVKQDLELFSTLPDDDDLKSAWKAMIIEKIRQSLPNKFSPIRPAESIPTENIESAPPAEPASQILAEESSSSILPTLPIGWSYMYY